MLLQPRKKTEEDFIIDVPDPPEVRLLTEGRNQNVPLLYDRLIALLPLPCSSLPPRPLESQCEPFRKRFTDPYLNSALLVSTGLTFLPENLGDEMANGLLE